MSSKRAERQFGGVVVKKFVSVLLLAGSAFFLGCWGSGEAKDSSERQAAFVAVFGFAPSSDVVNLKSHWFYLRDSYARWVCFSCNSNTMSSIRHLPGLKKAWTTRAEAPGNKDSASNRNAPSWWTKAEIPSNDLEAFKVDKSKPGEGESESIEIWLNEKANMVYAIRNSSR